MRRVSHEKIVAELRREHERERREWANQIERLLDRVMVLADKPPLLSFESQLLAPADVPSDFYEGAYPELSETD